MVSDFYNIPIGNVKKLVPNFFVKEKYVLHHENLQSCSRLGLKLKKIHCVLEFDQSQWLIPCVEFNTQKKKKNGKVVQIKEHLMDIKTNLYVTKNT